MKKITYYSVFTLILFGCIQRAVYVKRDTTNFNNQKRELFTYYLPKNLLRIQIQITQKDKKTPQLLSQIIEEHTSKARNKSVLIADGLKEEYYKLVRDHTDGMTSAIKVESTEYQIDEKGILVGVSAEPDLQKKFTVFYNNCPFKRVESSIKLNEAGMISSGSTAQADVAWEVTSSIVQFLVDMSGKSVSNTLPNKVNNGYSDEVTTSVKIDTVFDRLTDDDVNRIKQWCNQFKKITALKYSLLFEGEQNSVESLKYREELLKKEIEYMKAQLFGNVKLTPHYFFFCIDPCKEEFKNIETKEFTLMKFHKDKGMIIYDKSGKQVKAIPEMYDGKNAQELKVILTVPSDSISKELINTATNFAPEKNVRKKSFYYNVPSKVNLTMKLDNTCISFKNKADDKEGVLSKEIFFAQLGVVKYMPSNANKLDFEFYEDLGSLKSASFSRDIFLTEDKVNQGLQVVDSMISKYREFRIIEPENDQGDESIRIIVD